MSYEMRPIVLVALLILCSSPQIVTPARILAVFPHLGKSHFIFFEPLFKALAARGHDLVVISPFPQRRPVPRYTDISVAEALPMAYVNSLPFGDFGMEKVTPSLSLLTSMAVDTCEQVLSYPPVQKLIHSKEKFDLVLYESFNTDCFLGFVHRFQAPSITLVSSAPMPWGSDRFANPDNPSYIPNHFLAVSDRMNFYQRFKNSIYYVFTKLYYKLYSDMPGNKIARRYFGEDLPPLEAIAANTSLLLINTHISYYQARPNVPAIVEVGGLHVQPPEKLPQDLEKFISEAKHGVIYFSLGSTLRASTMPKHMMEAMVAAFSELPQRILWKWEDDSLPGKPDNVKISKWLPQMSILAHPNVKLFISHGGLMGTLEAIYNAVPMVSIPMFGDQFHNVELCVSKGITVKLPYSEITKETVLKKLRTVLNDPQYQENARRVSSIYHDRPQPALDTAIYWTEYVLRHHGAPHLRSAALDLNLFQYLLLDVLGFILTAAIALICVTVLILKLIIKQCKWVTNKSRTESPSKKGKKKQKAH